MTTRGDDQRRDCLRSLKTATNADRQSSPVSCPWDHWHEIIANPTLADAILDRLVLKAYRIDLTGESMRKQRSPRVSETAQSLT